MNTLAYLGASPKQGTVTLICFIVAIILFLLAAFQGRVENRVKGVLFTPLGLAALTIGLAVSF